MDPTAKALAEKIAGRIEARRSVEIVSQTRITSHDASEGDQDFNIYREHYIETAEGKRLLEMTGLKLDVLKMRSAHYYDGSESIDVQYKPQDLTQQATATIGRYFWMEDRTDRRQAPTPLTQEYVGRRPLHEALVDAERIGSSQCLGRDCAVYLFRHVGWPVVTDVVYHLDEAAAIPLKMEIYRNDEARRNQDVAVRWTVESLQTIQGREVPAKSIQQEFANGSPLFTWTTTLESISFDKEYPGSTFRPKFEPGVTVMDSVRQTSRKTPGLPPAEPTTSSQPAPPVNPAVPTSDGSGTFSLISLAVGCSLLLAAFIMAWRRR